MLSLHCFSHYFRIDVDRPYTLETCKLYASTLLRYSWVREQGRWVRKPIALFAATNAKRTYFSFHINLLQGFINFLYTRGYKDKDIQLVKYPFTLTNPEATTDMPTKVQKGWKPYDYQEPVIDYLISKIETPNHLVTLSTGEGKTSCLLFSIAKLQQTFLLLIKPAYMEKWYNDIHQVLQCKPDEVILVKGEAGILGLLNYYSNPANPKLRAIILSNKSYQLWLKFYEQSEEQAYYDAGYAIPPDLLYEHCNIGVRVIDEGHQDFHLCFKADLYTNVPRAITLSASMVDEDPFLLEMQRVMYPPKDRYKAPPPKKYTTATAFFYSFKDGIDIKTSWHGRTDYSHGAFEAWLLSRPYLLEQYFYMLYELIEYDYIKHYKEGDRLLVFCYSIDLATALTKYLSEKYPKLTVERYVEDDPYANVMEPDIRVSTVLSAGTGIDIKNLRVCILTQALSSIKANIQAFGRLRELKGDTRGTQFYYLNCRNIPQHLIYHDKKVELLRERTKAQLTLDYDKRLGKYGDWLPLKDKLKHFKVAR